ncbi:MAG: SRPBCC family protein [Gemmatales bacterium]
MLLYILLGIAALVVLFIIIVAMQPAQFEVKRSTTIAAPASTVFPLVNNLRMWPLWSPWEKLDPKMEKTFEGSGEGPGSSYAWNGNNQVGEGRNTILDTKQDRLVHIRLDFVRPFKASNDVKFTFEPSGNNTNVNWSMTGSNGFIGKAFCMFMNMDKMVGTDFEKGLAAMKAEAERGK